jgi:hypothetical protein
MRAGFQKLRVDGRPFQAAAPKLADLTNGDILIVHSHQAGAFPNVTVLETKRSELRDRFKSCTAS